MDPIIKWPGGKRSELGLILPAAPVGYQRIIEPFAGGAAVALGAEPAALWLNDAEAPLIDFYRRIASGRPRTVTRFHDLAAAFDRARRSARELAPRLVEGLIDERETATRFARSMSRAAAPWADGPALRLRALHALTAKKARLAVLATRAPISQVDRIEQLATALLAAFYTWIRDDFQPSDPDARAAAWWFLREMCYGSMFRYNRAGHFNIPYGGASYNDRDLLAKVALLSDPSVRALFARATLTDLDFRAFFAAYGTGSAADWIFLDPPYDSEFSTYADRPFGRADQEELAGIFATLDARALLVIKRTPFIERLYRGLARRNPAIEIRGYDHRYGYNVRGRNERKVAHLAISNYPVASSSATRRKRSR